MPSLKDIRRRIQSVQQTQQITRAMRMVSAAKLRRAQEAILAARPYAERMRATLAEVASGDTEAKHPLLAAREPVKRVEFVIVTSDRGLCGAFNANVIKEADIAVRERLAEVDACSLLLVGRKGGDYFRKRRGDSVSKVLTGLTPVDYAHASQIADEVSRRYLEGDTDEVVLLYSEFVSTMTQRPRLVRLLPVRPDDAEVGAEASDAEKSPYEIEPDAEALLRVLVPKALEVEIYRALLENQAGEHAARMAAMESATRNTEELIESLTLQYNRARQAAITKELVEIVSGAEAL